MQSKNNLKISEGFSLTEMIIYIAIMTLILIVVVNTLTIIIISQQKIGSLRVIEHSAAVFLDRLIREVRDASSIDTVQSQSGRLILNSTDDDGDPQKVGFEFSNNTLNLTIDGNLIGPIVDPEVKVNDFVFTELNASSTKGVRVVITLEAGSNQSQKAETFYTTAIFRNSQ